MARPEAWAENVEPPRTTRQLKAAVSLPSPVGGGADVGVGDDPQLLDREGGVEELVEHGDDVVGHRRRSR